MGRVTRKKSGSQARKNEEMLVFSYTDYPRFLFYDSVVSYLANRDIHSFISYGHNFARESVRMVVRMVRSI